MGDTELVVGYVLHGLAWAFQPGERGRSHIENGVFAHSGELLLENGTYFHGVLVIDQQSSGELIDVAILARGHLVWRDDLNWRREFESEFTSFGQETFSYRYFDHRAFPRDVHIDQTTGWSHRQI